MKKEINYVEGALPIDSYGVYIAKRLFFAVIIVLIFSSIVFGENLFFNLPIYQRIILIIIGINLFFGGLNKDKVPTNMTIKFYDDYMIIYRERHWYEYNVSRMEYEKILYDGLNINYYTKNDKIIIKGKIHSTYYKYDKNGKVKDISCFNKDCLGIVFFYTNLDDRDIIKILEENTHCIVNIF